LKELGYSSIYITDEFTEDIETTELIGPAIRQQANFMVFEMCQRQDLLKDNKKVENLRQLARDMVVEILYRCKDVTIDFPEIKTFENYLYLHSVNVAVLGVLIGFKLGLKDKMLEDFAVGALLHDIGKLELPQEVLNKNGPLTDKEFDLVKKHPRNGFNLLVSSSFIAPRSYTIALQHHESYDGVGYPSGRKAGEIHIFSRIASIVDIFDALTSDRPYKPRWSFHKSISYLQSIKNRFDTEVFGNFLNVVPTFPVGTEVKLSTGEIGIVFAYNFPNIQEPQIRILKDNKGRNLPKEEFYEVNIAENPALIIEYALD